MHVCDEGVGSLAAGQVLWALLPNYPANNQEARSGLMWEHIKKIYDELDYPACKRLSKLSLKDFKKTKKAPELDSKAAACRHFIPVLETLAIQNGYKDGCSLHKAVYNVARYVSRMYLALEEGNVAKVASNGFKFLEQYFHLEKHATTLDPEDTQTWRARPKFHLLQHLLDEASNGWNPKDSWNYRDETFAFTVQSLWFRRAGRKSAPGIECEKFFLRWSNCTQPLTLTPQKPVTGL